MLKFVSTKPPRGRSPSRAVTPDSEVSNRMSTFLDNSSRMHASPRSSRKPHSSSQSHTYPNTRSAHTTSKAALPPGYHPVTRSFTVASSRDIPGFGDYPTDMTSMRFPDNSHQHRQHQHASRQHPHEPILRHSDPLHHQQPIWSYQTTRNTTFVDEIPKPEENFSRYRYSHPSANNSSAQNNRLHLDLNNIRSYPAQNYGDKSSLNYSTYGDKSSLNYSTYGDKSSLNYSTRPQPSNVYAQAAISGAGRTDREPKSEHLFPDHHGLREPVQIIPEYVGGKGFRDITSHSEGSDYDLAKAIPGFQEPVGAGQPAGPRTTQYIVNETLTKKKTSETYIPPPGSGIKPYTQQEIIIEQFPANSPMVHRNFEYLQTSGTNQPWVVDVHRPAGVQAPSQVMTTCVSHATANPTNDAMNKAHSSKRSLGMSSQSVGSASTVRDMFNKSQDKSQLEGALTLDVVHITERIISMTFPSENHDTAYSLNLKEAVRVLKAKLGENFLILNLSEKHPDLLKAHPQVKEFGWPDHLAPPLERLCSICKAVDSWLSTDSRHVVVFHCKGGRSRMASIIAAYMHYNNICASADQAVDSRAMKRYYDEKLGGLSLPSQQRYVSYFSGLLSGIIKINSSPWYLHHILIHGVPNFDTNGGCCPFIKIYQSMQPIFTSGVYNVTDNMQKVCISITPGIPLRGDILIKCYHKKTTSGEKEVIWQCQFHTCAIAGNSLIFSKQELDDAFLDPRFPDTGKVEFVFGPSSDVLVSVSGFKSDVTVPVVDNEESLVRSGSYEDFNKTSDLPIDRYPGQTSSFNSHFSSGVNINRNNPPYTTSQINQTNQNNSTIGRRADKNITERIQLDELLSNLLSDQVHVSQDSQVQPRQSQPPPPSDTSGGITINPVMNSAKTVTTTTRTFTSYTSTDAHPNPDKVLIQRAEVSYKVPSQTEVKDHYSVSANSTDMLDSAHSSQSYHPKGVPHNAFSYTSGQSSSQRPDFVKQEVIRNQPEQSLQTPVSSQLSYYPKFEPKLNTTSSSHTYSSLDGETNSWLAQQQQKLKSFKEGRDPTGRSDQEQKMLNELQFAQNKYYTHQMQVEDKSLADSYNRQPLHNGPTSPERLSSPYAVPQRSHSSSAVDRHYQDQFYNSAYSTSFVESHTYEDKQSNKPPPSPSMQRSLHTATAPLPVPARKSSREFMRTLSNSSSSNWQQHKPLQRQNSETLYDRGLDVEPVFPRSYGSAHNTPPHSPARAISPIAPTSTTTYTSYRTIEKQRETQDDIQRSKVVQQQQQVLPPQQPPAEVNHHSVTEVFVHRTDVNKDNTDSTARLHELEKNLESVSQSIKSSQQYGVQQVPQHHGYEGHSSQQYNVQVPQQQVYEGHSSQQYNVQVPQQQVYEGHSSQRYQTYMETVSKGESVSSLHHSERRMNQIRSESPPVWDNFDGPEPIRVKEIEEDQIILRPIGPGMQTLEPESAHTGTLGRPSTPGFPTGPTTPPFPVSPRPPHHYTGGGSHLISSTGTLQPPQQHQQYQQYHQTQQYQTQSLRHDGQEQGTLHIDTSPRMFTAQQSSSAGSPSSPDNMNTFRQQMSGSAASLGPQIVRGQSSPSVYYGLSRRESLSSLTDTDMVQATPKFVKDTSKFWYKPNISREEAIQLLKDKHPGAFVIRDSNSFPGAYGLALKVATIPANVQAKSSGDPQADLVRHFLIEPTPKGVRLRGCSNEPVFGSLAALVYQHSVTPLALPWKLSLPEADAVNDPHFSEFSSNTPDVNSASTLLAHGAACNVIYINSVDLESLTGPQAIAKAVKTTFENLAAGRTTVVHFKVFNDGITLTDNNRKLFFRRHYPVAAVTYCGMDPQDRRWKRELDAPGGQGDARLFGFVARKQGSTNENTCHIFAELDPEQPASAIVNFVTKVMIGQSKLKS